jgi:hypothetical protein
MEWATGLITKATSSPFIRILASSQLTNELLIDITNLYRLYFKYIIWSVRNENMKKLEASKNINLKKYVMHSKRSHGSQDLPKSQSSNIVNHRQHSSRSLVNSIQQEIQLSTASSREHHHVIALDDITPKQYTNALKAVLQHIKPVSRYEKRLEWSWGLWTNNTLLHIKGSNDRVWRFNKNDAILTIGKNSGKIWNWWDAWKARVFGNFTEGSRVDEDLYNVD